MQVDAALSLLDSFSSSKSKPSIAFAPGRVNLIGEHTDYNQGYVFPIAISQGITIAAKPNGLNINRLLSNKAGKGRNFPAKPLPGSIHGWSRYVAAVAWALDASTCLDMAIVSNLPMSSGVSSSAALELASASIWNHIDNLNFSNMELAFKCQKAENDFVGVNCGIMDQMASAMGKKDHAMLIDTLDNTITYAPISSDLIVFVLDTGMPRSLAASGYNERRATCEEACETLNISSLRFANIESLNHLSCPLQYKRAKHVITENQRCLDLATALKQNNRDQIKILMNESHKSLDQDYEVSSPELNEMVNSALKSTGCIGSRMTGAGFGGCAIALVESDKAQIFQSECEHYYQNVVKHSKPSVFQTLAAEGAKIV